MGWRAGSIGCWLGIPRDGGGDRNQASTRQTSTSRVYGRAMAVANEAQVAKEPVKHMAARGLHRGRCMQGRIGPPPRPVSSPAPPERHASRAFAGRHPRHADRLALDNRGVILLHFPVPEFFVRGRAQLTVAPCLLSRASPPAQTAPAPQPPPLAREATGAWAKGESCPARATK